MVYMGWGLDGPVDDARGPADGGDAAADGDAGAAAPGGGAKGAKDAKGKDAAPRKDYAKGLQFFSLAAQNGHVFALHKVRRDARAHPLSLL